MRVWCSVYYKKEDDVMYGWLVGWVGHSLLLLLLLYQGWSFHVNIIWELNLFDISYYLLNWVYYA